MGSFSDYLENALLNHIFKGTAYSQPANIYIGLSTADPLDDGSGLAEPVGNNYARVNHNTWTTATAGATDNVGDITFPTATGDWGLVTHFAIFDAATGGAMLAHGALTTAKQIANGDTASFADGALDVTLD